MSKGPLSMGRLTRQSHAQGGSHLHAYEKQRVRNNIIDQEDSGRVAEAKDSRAE